MLQSGEWPSANAVRSWSSSLAPSRTGGSPLVKTKGPHDDRLTGQRMSIENARDQRALKRTGSDFGPRNTVPEMQAASRSTSSMSGSRSMKTERLTSISLRAR